MGFAIYRFSSGVSSSLGDPKSMMVLMTSSKCATFIKSKAGELGVSRSTASLGLVWVVGAPRGRGSLPGGIRPRIRGIFGAGGCITFGVVSLRGWSFRNSFKPSSLMVFL